MSFKGLCNFTLLFLLLASAGCGTNYGVGKGGKNTNILINPGFENGTDGWGGRGCEIKAITSVVHGGSGSAKALNRELRKKLKRQPQILDTRVSHS